MAKQWHQKGSVIAAFILLCAGVVGAFLTGTITLFPLSYHPNPLVVKVQVTPTVESSGLAPVSSPPQPPPAATSPGTDAPPVGDVSTPSTSSRETRRSRAVTPAEVTLLEGRPVMPAGIPADFSVTFDSVGAVDFVTLVVAPSGEDATSHAVLAPGANVPFHTASGERFNVQVLSIDSAARVVVVRVDRLGSR
jgi:hypothetical protein